MKKCLLLIIVLISLSCSKKAVITIGELNSVSPWKSDVEIKTDILGKAFEYRKKTCSNASPFKDIIVQKQLLQLDSLYKTEVNDYICWYRNKQIDSNDQYKYLSSQLEFELLYVIPDVFAVFINPVRRSVNKKISKQRFAHASGLINEILYNTDDLRKSIIFKKSFINFSSDTKSIRSRIFQGTLNEEERNTLRQVDYLLTQICSQN